MRILQGNLHRSRTADALLEQLRLDKGADLLIISEQYRNRDGPGWYVDTLGTAAIWIPNLHRVFVNSHGFGRGFVWVKCDDTTYVSCYFTPNESIHDFRNGVDQLEDTIRELGGVLVVAGDFNARALEWGMDATDARGRYLLEMAARIGLTVVNEGSTPTFRRPGCVGTIPDITLVSDIAAQSVSSWKVIEDYTGSDHQYITYNLRRDRSRSTSNHGRTTRWNVRKLNEDALLGVVEMGKGAVLGMPGPPEGIVDATMRLVRQACDLSMPRKPKTQGNKKAVYWWTDEISNLRRACLRLRRSATRARRRSGHEHVEEHAAYRRARKDLKLAISRSKRLKWEALRQDVDSDPWGLGYRIVMRKLGSYSPGPNMDAAQLSRIVDALFPAHPKREREVCRAPVEEIPAFTEEEMKQAASSLQNRKAPGPDGVPAEALRVIARSSPQLLLNMYNHCLESGIFPKIWKVQRLVLISKGKGDQSAPSAYRPLCMLDTAGKLLERLLKPRLAAAIQAAGDLSERQYGFRRGRSTIGAVEQVVRTFYTAQQGNHYSRKIVLLATLDVRNAFNSARWTDMLNALEHTFRIPHYLLRMVDSYLRDRHLRYDTADGLRSREITGGAAQGSILGPDLWNVAYDGILRMQMTDGTFLVGYADDIAAVVVARDTEDAQRKLNQVMRRVSFWLDDHGLSLATEKTEIVLLTRRRIPTIVRMQVGPEVITTKAAVRYLGVRLDTKLSFWEQIRQSSEKAAKVTLALSRLMANVGGPSAGRRRLLMSVTNAILLYGCEVWADALLKAKYCKQMASVQRRGALRVTSSYRTVSGPAVLVIAGVMPIDLMAQEKKRTYERKKDLGESVARLESRRYHMRCWEDRWQAESRGRWTKVLIGRLTDWVDRKHGEVNYYLSQFLTGHGYFNSYLCRVGKVRDPSCIYGDSALDSAHHTFFECSRWDLDRCGLEAEIGQISPDNIVRGMLNSKDIWSRMGNFVESVLRRKKLDMDRIQRL